MAKIPTYDSQVQLTSQADTVAQDINLAGQKGRSMQEAGRGFSALGEQIRAVDDVKRKASALTEIDKINQESEIYFAQNPGMSQEDSEKFLKDHEQKVSGWASYGGSSSDRAELERLAFKSTSGLKTKILTENIKFNASEAKAKLIKFDQLIIEKAGRGEDVTEELSERTLMQDKLVEARLLTPDQRANDDIKYDDTFADAVLSERYSNAVLSGDEYELYKFMDSLKSTEINGKPIPVETQKKYMTLASNAEAQSKIQNKVEDGLAMVKAENDLLKTGATKEGKLNRFVSEGGTPKFDKLIEEMNASTDQSIVAGDVPTKNETLNNLRLLMLNDSVSDDDKRLKILEETKAKNISWKDWEKVDLIRNMHPQDKAKLKVGLGWIDSWAKQNGGTEQDIRALSENFLQSRWREADDEMVSEYAWNVTNNFIKGKVPQAGNTKVPAQSIAQTQGGFGFSYRLLGGKGKDKQKADATIQKQGADEYEYKTVNGKTYRKKKNAKTS